MTTNTENTGMAKQSVYERITASMIESLEKGTVPWHRPWAQAGLGALPANLTSGKAYRGANIWVLGLSGYASRYWMTYRQAQDLGGQVRRGEKGTAIVFWSFPTKEEELEGKRPFARGYTVFNAAQVDGLEENERLKDEREAATANKDTVTFDPSTEADAVTSRYLKHNGPSLNHGGSSAFYTPSSDGVTMPAAESFDTSGAYYSVLFHELGHSTGHRDRLARDGVTNPVRFGSHDYSVEELVAELTASYLRAITGVDDSTLHDNSAAYLANWIKTLKSDSRMITTAAGQAQKAADMILGEVRAKAIAG